MSEGTVPAEVVSTDEAGNGDLPAQADEPRFDLARVDDPTAAIDKAEQLVGKMAEKCTGPDYIATIQGKEYPKVDWWTTVGASLGLFPREESIRLLDREGEVAYEATVGVYRGQELVTRASAICSDKEPTWSGRDEYAIRSMAITRATGKAFRLGLSFLPVMAGMEPTPAEEMPQGGGGQSSDEPWSPDHKVGFGKHSGLTWRELADRQPGYCDWILDADVDKAPGEAKDWLERALAGEEEGESLSARGMAQQRFLGTIEDFGTDADDPKEVAQAFGSWWSELNKDVSADLSEWDAARFNEAADKLEEGGVEMLTQVRKWAFEKEQEDDEGNA